MKKKPVYLILHFGSSGGIRATRVIRTINGKFNKKETLDYMNNKIGGGSVLLMHTTTITPELYRSHMGNRSL